MLQPLQALQFMCRNPYIANNSFHAHAFYTYLATSSQISYFQLKMIDSKNM